MTRTKKIEEDRAALVKKKYQPPIILIYGKLNRLTQGGSGELCDAESTSAQTGIKCE